MKSTGSDKESQVLLRTKWKLKDLNYKFHNDLPSDHFTDFTFFYNKLYDVFQKFDIKMPVIGKVVYPIPKDNII
jgi:hypothetical protein